jgi:bacteriocin-like protein
MDVFLITSLAVRISKGFTRRMTMEDERKPQDEPQDEVQDTEELSEEQLDQVVGGTGDITTVSNDIEIRHDIAKNAIGNIR